MSKTCKKCRAEVKVKIGEHAEGYTDKFKMEASCDCLSATGYSYSSAIKAWESEQRKRSKV